MINPGFTQVRFKTTSASTVLSFYLLWNEQGLLTEIRWSEDALAPTVAPLEIPGGEFVSLEQAPYGVAALARDLKSYFRFGEPLLPMSWSLVDTRKITSFQKSVYECIAGIPHGETRTYSWVAARVGKPLASRAVGQALRRNPFPVMIPCHRVVSDKNLGGFMGVKDPNQIELKFKSWLIELERGYLSPVFSFIAPALQLHPLVKTMETLPLMSSGCRKSDEVQESFL